MLEKYLNSQLVFPSVEASSKDGLLKELAEKIAGSHSEIDEGALLCALADREKLDSTAIESEIAIPHAKIDKLKEVVIAVARSKDGVNFDSHDGAPTRLFFVLLAPRGASGEHIKVLARLAKVISTKGTKEKLLEAETSKEIYDRLIEVDKKC